MQITIQRTVSLDGLQTVEALQGYTFTQEAEAHVFEITCTREGEELILSGECFAHFLRADNTTVYLGDDNAAITDGKARVSLHSDCYNVPGRFQLNVFYTAADGSATTCIYCCTGTVQRTQAGEMIDSGGSVSKVSYIGALFARNVGDIEGRLDEIESEHMTLTENLQGATETALSQYQQVINAIEAAGLDIRVINTPNLIKANNFWTNSDREDKVYGSASRWYGPSDSAWLKSIRSPTETVYTEEPADKGDAWYREIDTVDETTGEITYKDVWHVFKDEDGAHASVAALDQPIEETDGEKYPNALEIEVTANTAYGNAEMLIFHRGNNAYTYENDAGESVSVPERGQIEAMEDGNTYTMSCWARITSGTNARLRFAYGFDGWCNDRSIEGTYVYKDIGNTEWQRVYWTFVFDASKVTSPDINTGKRIGFGVCRLADATVQLCGFRLTAGGLYENNTIDTLAAEIAELRQTVNDLQAMVLEQ